MKREEVIANLIDLQIGNERKLKSIEEKRGIAAQYDDDVLEYLKEKYTRDYETIEAAIKYIRKRRFRNG